MYENTLLHTQNWTVLPLRSLRTDLDRKTNHRANYGPWISDYHILWYPQSAQAIENYELVECNNQSPSSNHGCCLDWG
jgi:hypothetical protein